MLKTIKQILLKHYSKLLSPVSLLMYSIIFISIVFFNNFLFYLYVSIVIGIAFRSNCIDINELFTKYVKNKEMARHFEQIIDNKEDDLFYINIILCICVIVNLVISSYLDNILIIIGLNIIPAYLLSKIIIKFNTTIFLKKYIIRQLINSK